MKCLVLGGSGFVGSAIVAELLQRGHEVVTYERTLPKLRRGYRKNSPIQYLQGDFTVEADFSSLVAGFDWVFHLICTALPADEDGVKQIKDNVLPTMQLLEACRQQGVKKVFFVSSGGSVYGLAGDEPIPETAPTNPICAYGVHKLAIEKYLQLYHHLYGLDYACMRLANPYGEGQNPAKPQGAIAAFAARLLADQPIEIWGDGSVVRDFVYADDVAKAALAMIQYEGPEKIFNIGSGIGYSLCELLQLLETVAGVKAQVRFTPGRRQDVPINILDISLAKAKLGWQPTVTLEDGLERLMKAWTTAKEKGAISYS